GLRDLPAGLFCDEAALGYNAWAILHYGVDENGVKLPLFLWSFTGYKNPVYLYAAMLPIGLLGLDEFSLRLTSAAFGIATVLALFSLGRALFGNKTGLAAAALLAICPWHIHFSRIAFEVISFPLLFALGLLFLIRFTRGERTLPLAFFFFGSCLYAYAIAKLFIPLFLIGFGLLYLPTIWRRFREWLIAVVVLLATVAPVVIFDLLHRQRGNAYFRANSIFRPELSLPDLAKQFGRNYVAFFSPGFLFRQGDGIVRHAVHGHGELYVFFAPFLLLGLGALLFRRSREPKLVFLWLLFYPVGASLMNEVPSASRGFIGSAALCLATGIGVAVLLDGLARLGRRPGVALALQLLVVAGLAAVAAAQTANYLRLYSREYPKYSAPTYGGFQYGYREVLKTMEPQRNRYARLMLTATDVNQPQIFPLFYNRLDPRVYARSGDPGYLVLVPGEYGRYSLAKPILYALRDSDLDTFTDYTVQKRVFAPGGQLEFVVAEVRSRKNYITDWQTLGPFPNADDSGVKSDFIDVRTISKRRYVTSEGPSYWREYRPQFVHMDLDTLYPPKQKNGAEGPAGLCGYFLTVAKVSTPRRA
ncbi:MAG TPA: glycosyltransferase family 39 protein, partial [Thermoanaerobaculia bacterium]|nr:glycosyltransferase family 39 protein [Thermoanaerobaculia bacterium]